MHLCVMYVVHVCECMHDYMYVFMRMGMCVYILACVVCYVCGMCDVACGYCIYYCGCYICTQARLPCVLDLLLFFFSLYGHLYVCMSSSIGVCTCMCMGMCMCVCSFIVVCT